MKTRFFLVLCLSLIAGSVFVAPEITWFGLSTEVAINLSRAMLLMGIVAAVLTVDAEDRELRGHME